MLVYAKELGSYFRGVTVRNPTLVLDQLTTEVYESDFVIDAWVEPTFLPSLRKHRSRDLWTVGVRGSTTPFIDALRDVILWSVTLAGICRALKRPLVKVSSVRVFDQVGHGRRRGVPSVGNGGTVGGLYLRAESLARQYYAGTVVYRAPILYGTYLDVPLNRVAEAGESGESGTPLGHTYTPEIETNEQMMLAFAGDFVDQLMAQIAKGPVDAPLNLWPYEDSAPLSWYDAALIAWSHKRDYFYRQQGYYVKNDSVFVPDVYGEGSYSDGFRRYREEEKAYREKAARVLRGDTRP